MKRFSEIVDDFGGPVKFAQALGIAESHARTMKARDSIPPEHWPKIVEEARRLEIEDITFEVLSAMRSARFTKQAAA